jgi:superfamily II DNA or RNA helicase
MFRVTPISGGSSFVVNADHILSLSKTNDGSKNPAIANIPVRDYLLKGKTFKHCYKLYRRPVSFPAGSSLPVDPYCVGVILGDGSIHSNGSFIVTKNDREVLDAIEGLAVGEGAKYRYSINSTKCPFISVTSGGRAGFKNKACQWLIDSGLAGTGAQDKFIPGSYLTASREDRLSVLAGLLDTDGSLHNNGYDFISKSPQLSAGVAYLSRSVGLKASVSVEWKSCQTGAGAYYTRVHVSGATNCIPCRVPRKIARERRQIKDPLVTGFSIEPVGHGDYYGFEITGDHLYLDGEFTVHHNSGKSVVMSGLINLCAKHGKKVVLYTNRKMLTAQTCGNLDKHGIEHGARAATQRDRLDLSKDIQVSSVATELRRVYEQKKWSLHEADLVIVDEAHTIKSGNSLRLLQNHLADGAKLLGVTATPLGISHLYPKLVVAGVNSEMRKCGAHVPAIVRCAHQMDVSRIKKMKTGEYSIGDIRKEIFSQAIVSYVYEDWVRYNENARQTLLMAPGVPESRYLAERFYQKGVSVAHIDAKSVWVNGVEHSNDDGSARQDVMDAWNAGDIKVVCNRFVLREAIDVPSLYHLILATPIGSLTTYLQVVGRVLRKSAQTPDHVLINDHGGCYHEHGSPNADQDWYAMYDMSETQISAARKKKLENANGELDPIVCTECQGMRLSGNVCPHCGFKGTSRTRVVIEQSGQLRKVDEPFFPAPKPRTEKDFFQSKWDQVYWRCRKSGRTFKQALVLFNKEHGLYPPKNLANMPISDIDWDRKIEAVPHMNLRREAERV